MTPQQAIQILRSLLNAGPVKLLLASPDICSAELALQALEKVISNQAPTP